MSKKDFEFLEEDDYEEDDKKVFFVEQITMKEVEDEYYDMLPFFVYQYIDLDKTDYAFNQPCFDNNDIIAYFKKVKQYSQVSIGDLIYRSRHKEHFHILSVIPYRVKQMIEEISGKNNIKDENLPLVGQFGLYTNENADRNTNVKSPRIFFFIGKNTTINILFYDPYHEIFNAKNKKKN